MLVPFILLPILVIPGLISSDIYAKEGTIYGAIWLVCLLGFPFTGMYGFWFVVPMALVDIGLLIKLVGNQKRGELPFRRFRVRLMIVVTAQDHVTDFAFRVQEAR